MKRTPTKISLFIVLISLFFSCNVVKRVPDGEYLLTKNTILVDSVEIKDAGVYSQLAQKPNPSIPLIGIPFGLLVYNLADPHPDSTYTKWLHKNPKREERLIRFLSKKQVNQIDSSYVGLNEWLQKSGDAPVIITENRTEKSIERLKRWYASYGYFNDEVDYKIIPSEKKKKRAEIIYSVKKHEPYFVGDSIIEKISSPVVDSLFQITKNKSFIVPGKQYTAQDFVNERDRLTIQLRNSGLYYFEQDYVGFEADTVNTNHKANITYIIPDRTITNEADSTYAVPFKVHKINEVRIVTDFSYENRDKNFQDSISFKGYKLFSYGKMRFRPKAIADAIAITPGKIYKDIDRTLTYNQISDLGIFKYPNINYAEIATDTTRTLLNSTILLSPRDKFTLGVDFDTYTSTIQQFGISFSGNMIFRNIFRGAEILEISGRGSLGSSKDAADNESFFNISEFGGDVKLTFPRILFPINTEKLIPKYMSPSTSISLGLSAQNNIGLDRQSASAVYNYSWKPSKILTYQLDLFNLQFVRNLNISNYYNVYTSSYNSLNQIAQDLDYDFNNPSDDPQLEIPEETEQFIDDVLNNNIVTDDDTYNAVLSINERQDRLTENNLIFATNITLTRDTRENINDNNFSRLRMKLESAGNLLSGIANLAGIQKNADGKYETLDVVYSQYIKGETEYIKHWELNSENIVAVRAFGGIAIPYGNSSNIPFTRSYFAGGANDNRGWKAYDLGPGSSGSVLDFNDANFKLAFNAEYRFTILGAFKGAFFVDAGNIWNAFDDVETPSFRFNGIEDLKEIAVASGFGLRYDFGFFVFRFDTGFKTHNPGRPVGERWFKDYNFSKAVYNIGINYPF